MRRPFIFAALERWRRPLESQDQRVPSHRCTAYTHEATAFPSIAPADEEVCDDAYETAAAAAAETRQGVVDLVYEGRCPARIGL